MSDHTKFDFATVFTPGAPHPDDDPHALVDPADVPVYSQNQMDAALAEARNEGSSTATEAAAQNADAVANQVLAQINEQFGRLGTFQDSIVTAIHSEAVELSLMIGQKLARSLMMREPKAEVESLILELLQQHSEVGGTPKIVVRVHPVVAPDIQARIESLKNNVAFTGEVTVLAAEGFGPTDCSVEWADGGAVRNLKQLEEDVTQSVKRYLGALESGATDQTPDEVGAPVEEAVAAQPVPEPVEQPVPAITPEQAPEAPSVIDEIAAEAIQAAAPQDPVAQ